MVGKIRVKGRYDRQAFGRQKSHTIFMDDKLREELAEHYDTDSLQALFYALALDAVGRINLKKDRFVDIEEVTKNRLADK